MISVRLTEKPGADAPHGASGQTREVAVICIDAGATPQTVWCNSDTESQLQ